MKKHFNQLLIVLLTICIFGSTITTTAFASSPNENSIVITAENITNPDESIVPLSNNIIYPDTTTLTLTKTVSKVTYTGTYGLFGSSGVVVLRFTNKSTGESRTHTFVCDQSSHTDSLGINPYPAGTYSVTVEANTVKNFRELYLNFS